MPRWAVWLLTVALIGVAAPAGAQDTPPGLPPGSGVWFADGAATLTDGISSLADVDLGTGITTSIGEIPSISDQMATVVDLVAAGQLASDALRAAEAARQAALRRRQARLPDSVPYAAEFEAAGTRHGVEPALLAAVAQTESGFRSEVVNCTVTSTAGARGLMQFMPATAAGFGIDPCVPSQAIDAAARYLAQLYARFGDWDLTLAAYNWGPGNVSSKPRSAWPTETRTYVAKVRAAWEAYRSMVAPVGADGCPTVAAPNTLRGGSSIIGIAELCRRSVAAAPTPAAARAIIVALGGEFLGKPYSQPRREEPGWYDCSSFVTRAYTVAGTKLRDGWSPTTAIMTAGVGWARRIPVSDARPGDLVLEPAPGHVGMLLADGFWVHTNRTGDVSHITRAPTSPDLVLRVTA